MRSTLHDPLLTPENRLWRAVLEQAYSDAESPADVVSDGDSSPERIRARQYLRGDNAQEAAALGMVCSFAEIPSDRVVTWARRNYPRTRMNMPGQNAIAIVGARHSRARSCAEVSA